MNQTLADLLRRHLAAENAHDLDGTLVRTNLVHAFAYNAKNQQGLWKSVIRTATTLLLSRHPQRK